MNSPVDVNDFGLAELASEAWEPAGELGLLMADPIYWGWGVPRGDRRPVLVLPGLFGGDRYLGPLRDWLQRIGYTPVPSGLERNPGWSEPLVNELGELAESHFKRSGQRVAIIGHSLGGLQGRSVAARRPAVVRHLIALGSPLAMARAPLPPQVRMTAIHSRGDRIVRHPASLERDPRAENIEVRGSHFGLAYNPAVYRVLARALCAPDPEVVGAMAPS
jgi:triacylglycerol lipase